ncbi:MAG: ChbG/HpnK family deacetylase [Chthoniobacter sp.]|nr:ChbG/HpnK family deacetylase [Chthoniobacter sp.]
MTTQRYLIVNADDFGLSVGTNAGIIAAHERGIVTSASLMVRQPAALAAAEYARKNAALSVGLHLDLGEWTLRAGEWMQAYEVVPHDDPAAVACEVARQLCEFRRLMGREPTHLDSHQHIHRHEPVREIVTALGAELGLPVRDFCPAITYRGDFYGQGHKCASYPEGITIANLLAIFRQLPPGLTELGCHPGADEALDSAYCTERLAEVTTLCDPQVRAGLHDEGIELVSFSTLPAEQE